MFVHLGTLLVIAAVSDGQLLWGAQMVDIYYFT